MHTADQPHDPRRPGAGRSRRDVLRGVVGVVAIGLAGSAGLAGCDLFGTDDGDEPPASTELLGFLTATASLEARYTATMTAVPALTASLTPVRDAHRQHLQTLAGALGVAVPQASPGDAPPAERAEALAALATAEKAARDDAVAKCLAATPRLASLLGAIAAARATHLEVLK